MGGSGPQTFLTTGSDWMQVNFGKKWDLVSALPDSQLSEGKM